MSVSVARGGSGERHLIAPCDVIVAHKKAMRRFQRIALSSEIKLISMNWPGEKSAKRPSQGQR